MMHRSYRLSRKNSQWKMILDFPICATTGSVSQYHTRIVIDPQDCIPAIPGNSFENIILAIFLTE